MPKTGIIVFEWGHAVYWDGGYRHVFFNTWQDLPDDVVWLSDMPRENLWLSGWQQHRNIKDKMYFNIPFSWLLSSFGGNIGEYDTQSGAVLEKLLFVCHHLLSRAFSLYQADFDAQVQEFSTALASGLAKHRSAEHYDEEVNNLLQRIYAEDYRPLRDSDRRDKLASGAISVHLKRNGVVYAKRLWQNAVLPVNEGRYKVLGRKELRQMQAADAEQNGRKPLQEFVQTLPAPYLVLSATGKRRRQTRPYYENRRAVLEATEVTHTLSDHLERVWLTHDEYPVIQKFSIVDVEKAVLLEAYADEADLAADCGLEVPALSPLSPLSVADCILAENYCLALQERQILSGYIDFVGAFLSVADKKETLLLALYLSDKGFTVDTFGRNNLFAVVEPENLADFLQEAGRYGFIRVE